MKLERLIGILMILIQNEKVTAPELADRFDVSRRTINRDIEDLCKAGIPLQTIQGAGGGIRIIDGYIIEKRFFTVSEMQSILAGLKGIDGITGKNEFRTVFDKLFTKNSEKLQSIYDTSGYIKIDLTSYNSGRIAEKFQLLLEGIENCRKVSFDYYTSNSCCIRVIEPVLLVFQWSQWYIYGYCSIRNDYRLFKLNRIENEFLTDDYFERKYTSFLYNWNKIMSNNIHLVAEFDTSQKYRLIEDYGIECIKNENEKIIFEFDFTNEDYLLSWIMGFGDKVTILSPDNIKLKHKQIIFNMMRKYF